MAKRTADYIKADIEEAILIGDYAEGDRLDEMRLSEKYEVSRTPVREALQILSTSGLVQLIPHRGAFVRFPSFEEIVEMFEVMGELESMAARLAARRITKTQLQALNAACAACSQAESEEDADSYFSENEEFHHLIYDASSNSFLAGEAKRLYRRLQPIRRLQLQARGRLSQSMAEHIAIRDAINAGDGNKAGNLLRGHVIIQGEKFNDLIAGYKTRGKRITG